MTTKPPVAALTAYGPARQAEIYAAGVGMTAVPADYEALRAAAEHALSPAAFAYADGGAGAGSTMAANRRALDHWAIVPRMLRDVAKRDTGLTLFGRRLPAPLIAAPIGVQELAHPEADLATARACAAEGVPMIFSNQASFAMEETAAAMGDAPRWFQLYWSKSDALVESLVHRAEACGCDAIVVTLDTPLLGWRTADLDLASLPFLKGQGLAQYLGDPVFRSMLARPPEEDMSAAIRLFLETYSNPSLGWERLGWLRSITALPILVKGVLHAQDAEIAAAHGVDGIIVSNHGGRQIDGSVGAADALDHVARCLGGRLPIMFDSGIRGGADVLKALALGACAVLIGRPLFYALAVGGERGVREMLRNIRAELDLTMGLAGLTSLAAIERGVLVKAV